MSFLASLFPGKKPPTADSISREIARLNAATPEMEAAVTKAEAGFDNIAAMSDADLEAVEHARTMAKAKLARHQAQVRELQAAFDDARKAEEAAALEARSTAADKAAADAGKVLDRIDAAFAAAGNALAELKAIEDEVREVNVALRKAGRTDQIESPSERFRRAPDRVTPETRRVVTEWHYYDALNGKHEVNPPMREFEGRMVPTVAGARAVEREIVTPGSVKRGDPLPSLLDLHLPPARYGSPTHWPKAS